MLNDFVLCGLWRVRSAVIVSAQRIKSNLYLIQHKLSHIHVERLRHCCLPPSPLLTAGYIEGRTAAAAAAAAAAVMRRLTRRRRVGETGENYWVPHCYKDLGDLPNYSLLQLERRVWRTDGCTNKQIDKTVFNRSTVYLLNPRCCRERKRVYILYSRLHEFLGRNVVSWSLYVKI